MNSVADDSPGDSVGLQSNLEDLADDGLVNRRILLDLCQTPTKCNMRKSGHV